MIRAYINATTKAVTRAVIPGFKWNYPALLNDGYSAALFRPKDDSYVTRDGDGGDIIWWDVLVGKRARGAVLASGSTELWAVYEIVSCQDNYFFPGCKGGDVFPCGAVKNLDANNTVKRCLGNHVCQPVATKRPKSGLFDGVDDIMRSASFTLTQPLSVYAAMSIVNWVTTKMIIDGFTYNSVALHQTRFSADVDNQLKGYAGVYTSPIYFPENKKFVLRAFYNGATSKLGVNGDTIIHDAGIKGMGGITIGGGAFQTNGFDFSNIDVSELFIRTKIDELYTETDLYNYLNYKYNINDPDIVFDNAKLVISSDDGIITNYSGILPLLASKGVVATFYIVSDLMGTDGYMTWENVLEMHNAGMDMQCHTKSHNVLSTVSPANIITNLQAVNTAFTTNGLPAPKHIAYPFGNYDDEIIFACRNGLRDTGRTTAEGYVRKNTHKYEIPSFLIDGVDETKLNTLKGHIDHIVASREAMTLFTHGIEESSEYGHITPEYLTAIIDYAQLKGVDIITMTQLHALMNTP